MCVHFVCICRLKNPFILGDDIATGRALTILWQDIFIWCSFPSCIPIGAKSIELSLSRDFCKVGFVLKNNFYLRSVFLWLPRQPLKARNQLHLLTSNEKFWLPSHDSKHLIKESMIPQFQIVQNIVNIKSSLLSFNII